MKRKVVTIILALCLIAGLALPCWAANPPVKLEAPSAILTDNTGQVLFEQNADEKLAPASMTKLMTLLLAVEAIQNGKVRPYEKVVASENAWRLGGTQIYLEPGEELTYHDMLLAIALGSANDACMAIAEHLEGSHDIFVEKMNEKAREIGMKNTRFANAYGLPAEGHYTTARDMALLARYCLRYPQILEYTSVKEYSLRQGEFKLFNTNKLLWWYRGADGFKTGWTNEAKYCVTATAKRDGLRLITVVMAAPKARGNFRDAMALFNYGFARYGFKSFFGAGAVAGTVKVGEGVDNMVEAVAVTEVGAVYEKGTKAKIEYRKNLPEYVNAPVVKGQRLGDIEVIKDGKVVEKVELVASRDVPRCSFVTQIRRLLAKALLI